MDSEINELIVLQLIYTILSVQNNVSNVNECKVSLVKLTNEFQNNILVNQIINDETKLDINDILVIVKKIFPNQRISLVDGQLSFHNLTLREVINDINTRVKRFIKTQTELVRKIEDEIIDPPNPVQRPVNAVDPKKAKLLQLYRDTVLNKLQTKSNNSNNRDLEWLYGTLAAEGHMPHIVKDITKIDSIRNETPVSVHELQLTLQKSICDGLMSCYTGSATWHNARRLQIDLDDTVQFMRRALE